MSICIQIKSLLEYNNILFLLYISVLFYLFPEMIIFHLKNTQYTFKKEDFVLLVFTKNIFGELAGSYIYDMGGMSMVLNFSWVLSLALCFILYFEFTTVEKKINTNKKVNDNKNKKIEKYRTTVTSDIQGEELQEIDNRESIISVDDTDDNNDKNANKEHEYNLDDYIKK